MLNPFKKKDDSFRLDDISLPSLNDEPNNPSEMHSLDSPTNDINSMPELPSLDSPHLSSEPDYSQNTFNSNAPMPGDNSNPMLNPTPIESSQPMPQQDNSVHSEITKAQLETMMTKISLMDARQQNMEQKLEMIYQIILNEVSEDTRRKLNIDSMMNKIRN